MFSAFEHFAQAKLYHFPEVWDKKRNLFQPPSSDTKHEILLGLSGIHNDKGDFRLFPGDFTVIPFKFGHTNT